MNTTTSTPATATQMAKHFRSRLKAAGIKASCRVAPGSKNCVQISPPAYGIEFTEAEQREIRIIAKVNGMTRSRGMEIDIEQMTDSVEALFFIY